MQNWTILWQNLCWCTLKQLCWLQWSCSKSHEQEFGRLSVVWVQGSCTSNSISQQTLSKGYCVVLLTSRFGLLVTYAVYLCLSSLKHINMKDLIVSGPTKDVQGCGVKQHIEILSKLHLHMRIRKKKHYPCIPWLSLATQVMHGLLYSPERVEVWCCTPSTQARSWPLFSRVYSDG